MSRAKKVIFIIITLLAINLNSTYSPAFAKAIIYNININNNSNILEVKTTEKTTPSIKYKESYSKGTAILMIVVDIPNSSASDNMQKSITITKKLSERIPEINKISISNNSSGDSSKLIIELNKTSDRIPKIIKSNDYSIIISLPINVRANMRISRKRFNLKQLTDLRYYQYVLYSLISSTQNQLLQYKYKFKRANNGVVK